MDHIRSKVSDLLRNANVQRPPVPVEKIAEMLKLEVRYSPSSDDVSGTLIRKGKELIIGINSNQHPNRQRFTIAHEVGHFVMQKSWQLHVDEDFCINRDGSNNSEEIEANRFAAELLMPVELIEIDVSRFKILDEAVINVLAGRYKVSTQAMQIRLTNLGYISPY